MLGNFFLDQLRLMADQRGLTVKGDQAIIRCPYHSGGNERTPSLGILLVPKNGWPAGSWNCLACPEHGGYNKLAAKLGLKLAKKSNIKESASAALLQWPDAAEAAQTIASLPHWPAVEWRGIAAETLRRFDARTIFLGRTNFMHLPVTLYGEAIGGVHCRLDKAPKGEKSYINTDGDWTHRTFFGFDQARKREMRRQPLWIVEGPRDALNVVQYGARAIALLGAANITQNKIALIEELDPPVIVLALDDDAAGEQARDVLYEKLGDKYRVRKLRFKKAGQDPADLTDTEVRTIIQRAAVK